MKTPDQAVISDLLIPDFFLSYSCLTGNKLQEMEVHSDKTKTTQSQAVADVLAQSQSGGEVSAYVDNRPGAVAQRKLQEIADNSSQVKQLATFQKMADSRLQVKQSVASPVVQRQLLPIARHREIVNDAAKRLDNPAGASDNKWIQAIYAELDGIGNPAADKCVEKLIEQRVIDQNDWNLIERDYKLFKSSGEKELELHERHNAPSVHNEDEADKWVASLIKNRIDDLYSTLPGFPGHAQQIQLSINLLVGWYKEGKFKKEAYEKYKDQIVLALTTGKGASRLAIPKFVYTFEDGSTAAV